MFPKGWKQSKYLEVLHDFTNSVIEEREKNFKDSDIENLNDDSEDSFVVGKKRLAMLDLLIKEKRSKQGIDIEGIREEVDTFMFEARFN